MASKKVYYAVIGLLAVILIAVAANFYYVTPTTTYKYSTGLTVDLKVNNFGTSALVVSNCVIQFFPVGTDPVGTKTFSTVPIDQAAYDSTNGYWTAQLDQGTYTVLVYSTNNAFYPSTFTITVPGTNNDARTVWAEPATLAVYTRQTTTPEATTIKATADSTGVAITPTTVSTLNTTTYSEWRITYVLDSVNPGSAPNAILPDSILYLPASITGLSVVSATVNGIDGGINQNLNSASGPVGYQVGLVGTNGVLMQVSGTSQLTIVVTVQANGVTAGGSWQAKLFEDSSVLRTSLRYWGADANIGSAITVEQ